MIAIRPRVLVRLTVFSSLLVALFLSVGCATLTPRFESPAVELISLKMLPSDGLSQQFEVGLRVTNPNSSALKLKGMSYSLSINDYKLASGVTSAIPVIEAYGTGELIVPVSTNLFGGLRLVQSLLQTPQNEIRYRLEASLDPDQIWLPRFNVVEEGVVPLAPVAKGKAINMSM